MTSPGDTVVMRQYVIYRNPSDVCAWPRGEDVYIAREWLIVRGEAVAGWIIAVSRTLEEVRRDIPRFADARLERFDDDDPVIVEVWV